MDNSNERESARSVNKFNIGSTGVLEEIKRVGRFAYEYCVYELGDIHEVSDSPPLEFVRSSLVLLEESSNETVMRSVRATSKLRENEDVTSRQLQLAIANLLLVVERARDEIPVADLLLARRAVSSGMSPVNKLVRRAEARLTIAQNVGPPISRDLAYTNDEVTAVFLLDKIKTAYEVDVLPPDGWTIEDVKSYLMEFIPTRKEPFYSSLSKAYYYEGQP